MVKKVVLKNIAVVFVIALLLASAACTRKQSGEMKDSLIAIAINNPVSLDPYRGNDGGSAFILKHVYNTLFTQNFTTMAPEPSLAERYEFENNERGEPTQLRIFLKKGVKFHNGEELKASDVKFSIERAITSPYIGHITGSIQSVEVSGDYEALITLKYPFAPILNNLSHFAMSIVNEKAVTEGGESYAQNPVGTGPLKFVNWVAGNRVELTRWDEYHEEPSKVKDITIRYITDPATAFLELETGGADILLSLMPYDVRRVEENPNLRLVNAMDLRVNFIGFNVQKKPFDDVRVRQAIFHAIDTEALVNTVYQGVGKPGRGPLAATVWASAADSLPPYEYNLDKAKALLAEAGFPNGFSTTIHTSEAANLRDTAEVVRGMLARVGITADINVIEWANYLETTTRGDQAIYLLGWTTVTGDPDYGLEIFHTRAIGSSGNRSFYSNPEVDRLLDSGRTETNRERRQQIYYDAQRLIHADAPWVYTQEGEVTVGVRSNVRGFQINPSGQHPLWTVYFE